MSRQPRAGTAAGKVTIRATDSELELWEQAAKHAGVDRSTWLRQAALELAAVGRRRGQGWMRPAKRTQGAP
jgi:uncharacterized protein (DUF1778 family)